MICEKCKETLNLRGEVLEKNCCVDSWVKQMNALFFKVLAGTAIIFALAGCGKTTSGFQKPITVENTPKVEIVEKTKHIKASVETIKISNEPVQIQRQLDNIMVTVQLIEDDFIKLNEFIENMRAEYAGRSVRRSKP